MKRKLFIGIVVMAITALAAWNVNYNSHTKGMSNLSLANVEALASGELTGNCSGDSSSCELYCPNCSKPIMSSPASSGKPTNLSGPCPYGCGYTF